MVEKHTKGIIHKSQTKRIKTLLKKQRKLIKTHLKTVPFEEPVVFMMKSNGTTDFYEKATAGQFIFEKSDGTNGSIILHPNQQTTFNYGKTGFKGYICYEDEALPYPQDPILYAETYEMGMEKVMNDIRKHRNPNIKAWGGSVKAVLLGIAAVIAVILAAPILAGLFGAEFTYPWVQTAAETAVTTAQTPVLNLSQVTIVT